MEGNEPGVETCLACKQTCGEDYYKCDSCLRRIHKECSKITPSEVKCMPLQRRVLLFMCCDCKQYIARMPYMVKLLEEMKKDIENLKSTYQNQTYASTLQNNQSTRENIVKSNLHTIIIKPKVPQATEKSRKDVQKTINPTRINVGIRNIKETKKGNIVLKCDTEQEMKRLKEEAERKLKGKYDIELPKKILPKIKIAGYTGEKPMEILEETMRQQNKWIDPEEHLKVTFTRRLNNKSTTTIYAECSGSLHTKMLNYGKIYIDWERLPIYEDLTVARCYKCQGFHHKSNKCTKPQICGNCAEAHDTMECENRAKSCINCVMANRQYGLKYMTSHSALDANCPSLKYHMGLVRNRTDYNCK